jgi:hypothetical protein
MVQTAHGACISQAEIKKSFANDSGDEMHESLEDEEDEEVGNPIPLGYVGCRPEAVGGKNPDGTVDHGNSVWVGEAIFGIRLVYIFVHELGKAAWENIFISLMEDVERGGRQQGEEDRTLGKDKCDQIDCRK